MDRAAPLPPVRLERGASQASRKAQEAFHAPPYLPRSITRAWERTKSRSRITSPTSYPWVDSSTPKLPWTKAWSPTFKEMLRQEDAKGDTPATRIGLCALPNDLTARTAMAMALRSNEGIPGAADLTTLPARMTQVRQDLDGRILWYVKDLGSGQVSTVDADEPLFLAEAVKLFILMGVIEGVTPEHSITIAESDYVDGSPRLNPDTTPPGTSITVEQLTTWMLEHDDHTATDQLWHEVQDRLSDIWVDLGLPTQPTSFSKWEEVRAIRWSHRCDAGYGLTGRQLIALYQEPDIEKRLALFAQIVGSEDTFTQDDYATVCEVNTGIANTLPMSVLGQTLEVLHNGTGNLGASAPTILAELARCPQSPGFARGLPEGAEVIQVAGQHDTEILEAGIVTLQNGSKVIIAASVQDRQDHAAAHRALESLGRAVFWS